MSRLSTLEDFEASSGVVLQLFLLLLLLLFVVRVMVRSCKRLLVAEDTNALIFTAGRNTRRQAYSNSSLIIGRNGFSFEFFYLCCDVLSSYSCYPV